MTITKKLINNFEYLLSKIKIDNQTWEYKLSSINKKKIESEMRVLYKGLKLNDISKNKKKYLIIQICYHIYIKLLLLGNKLFNIRYLPVDYNKKEISETLDILIVESYNNIDGFLKKILRAAKKDIKLDTININEINLLMVTLNHLLTAIIESIDFKKIIEEMLNEYEKIKQKNNKIKMEKGELKN